MTRTNVDIDDEACATVMRRYQLATKRDAINFASRTLAAESVDYDAAAALYRTCRQPGRTVRKLIDCLIAAVAIRDDVPIFRRDADFDILTQYTALQIDTP